MRLPLTVVKAEVEKFLDLAMLESDSQLIAYLEQLLWSVKMSKANASGLSD